MAEEIYVECVINAKVQDLVTLTLTLTLDQVMWYAVVHHSISHLYLRAKFHTNRIFRGQTYVYRYVRIRTDGLIEVRGAFKKFVA